MLAAMAMYIETTREKSNADATTLEEAAEELLNGLLCHYEPPDARTQQRMQEEAGEIKKSRSILKQSKTFKRKGTKSRRSVGQRVRWKDEQNQLKTPDIYDIGKGCQEALAECNDDGHLEQETARLAQLTSQREPRPIAKRVRNHHAPRDDVYGQDVSSHPMQTYSEDSANMMNNYGGAPNDPISKYRVATLSPKEPAPAADDTDSLFDDLGNVVEKTNQQDNAWEQRSSQYGPPPSPSPRDEPPPPPPRRQQTPYKQPPPSRAPKDRAHPSTLCGIMCDPKYLNCEVRDGDYEDEDFPGYTPPPPPPPPPSHYFYEDPENSVISGSESNYSDEEEDDEGSTPKRSLRDRFRRKSKKKSKVSAEEAKSPSRKSRGRSRSRSPGRTTPKSPRRSKSPGKSRKDKKFPRSPMSFITGNRSFSQSPRTREESEANLSMQSMESEGSNIRRKSKSPRRKWFGRSKNTDEDKKAEVSNQFTSDNDDWAPPPPHPHSQKPPGMERMAYNGYEDPMLFHERGRTMERQGHLQSYRLDTIDRSRLSDFADPNDNIDRSRLSDFADPNEDELGLRPTRSQSLDRQDEGRRSRLQSYDRAESHIGLSRMSFDEPETQEKSKVTRSRSLEKLEKWFRPRRGRSKERSEDDQQLRPSRSRSLERDEWDLWPSRSRSLDRKDQGPQGTSSYGNPDGGYEMGYDNQSIRIPRGQDQQGLVRTRSRSFDGQLDPRRASYPFVPQEPSFQAYGRGYPPEGHYDNRTFSVPPHQIPHSQQWQQRPAPMITREEYLDSQYNNFMAQRSPSYPPHTPSGSGQHFSKPNRRSFDYSDIRQGISQMWGGVPKSQSMEHRKMAAEPPAALYSYVPEPPTPQQVNSIYSHDLGVKPAPAMERRGMPPTPMQREQVQQQYPQHYTSHGRHMPPTPMQHGHLMRAQPNQVQYEQVNNYSQPQPQPVQVQRDPTPRNQIVDFIQSQFQQNPPPTKPPSPPRPTPRPFSVAEEIHRVSWGEARQGSRDETSKAQEQKPATMIPHTLPGKEKSKSQPSSPPPPPPPPPPREQPQQRPPTMASMEGPTMAAMERPTMAAMERPPRPVMPPDATSKSQVPEEKQLQFTDIVDENKPVENGLKRDGKTGRKLLGIFNRNKKKKAAPSQRPQVKSEENSNNNNPEVDMGSIISDAVLRDRHDRFVTKL